MQSASAFICEKSKLTPAESGWFCLENWKNTVLVVLVVMDVYRIIADDNLA